jgi:hypothetical protein
MWEGMDVVSGAPREPWDHECVCVWYGWRWRGAFFGLRMGQEGLCGKRGYCGIGTAEVRLGACVFIEHLTCMAHRPVHCCGGCGAVDAVSAVDTDPPSHQCHRCQNAVYVSTLSSAFAGTLQQCKAHMDSITVNRLVALLLYVHVLYNQKAKLTTCLTLH